MSLENLSFSEVNKLVAAQDTRHEKEYLALLRIRPLPETAVLLSALQHVAFTKHGQFLSEHPGARALDKLEVLERSHKLLLSFFDDLNAAFGRFQGIANARPGLGKSLWDEIAFSFTKTLFAFSAAAKARDEMLGRLTDRRVARGSDLVRIARAEFSDVELTAFVHELRNHLSHSTLEEPGASIHWDADARETARARVSVPSSRFNSSRWPADATAFLARADEIDLMQVAVSYVRMASKSQEQMLRHFWGTLTDDERGYLALSAELHMRSELTSYGIWVQVLNNKPELNLMRFMHDRIPSKYLGMVRAFDDYSEEQFEAIATIMDPFALMEPSLRDRLKARFMARPVPGPVQEAPSVLRAGEDNPTPVSERRTRRRKR